jgi:hypothetical protein
MNSANGKKFPTAVRWGAVVWLLVWVPVYWKTWGAANFLRFCDVAVFLTCAGFFFGSDLLLSSQAVGAIIVDAVWTLDVGWKIIFGRYLVGGTEYMFDPQYPLWVRLLSLFHVAMPALLLWAVRRNGYDRRGLALQSAIAAVVFIASRFMNPALNTNYAFADPFFHRQWGPAPVHLLVAFVFMVIVVYVPTDFVLRRFATVAPRDGKDC